MSEKTLNEVVAFAPGHITGFFEICDESGDILHKGSRGAGVCITRGVKTCIKFRASSANSTEIFINGQKTSNAIVTQEVINLFRLQRSFPSDVVVEHTSDIPIGCGLGASGGCALSLAYLMNQKLNVFISSRKASQIAHIAEVRCKTGLGTVLAQTVGGLVVRQEPGAPGVGVAESIPVDDDYLVLCLVLGEMHTEKMLSDAKIRKRINENGKRALQKFLSRPSIENFMAISRDFAESVGLMSEQIRKIIDEADKNGFICSQAMFGETVFSIVKTTDAPKLIGIFNTLTNASRRLIVADIDHMGARILL